MGICQSANAKQAGKKLNMVDKPTGQKKAVDKRINDIWAKYDTDGNNYLDPEEVKQFCIDTL